MTFPAVHKPSKFQVYVTSVIVLGLAALAWALFDRIPSREVEATALMWVFVVCVILAELFPVNVHLGGREGEIVTSTSFAFAILIIFGAWAA